MNNILKKPLKIKEERKKKKFKKWNAGSAFPSANPVGKGSGERRPSVSFTRAPLLPSPSAGREHGRLVVHREADESCRPCSERGGAERDRGVVPESAAILALCVASL